MGKRQNSEVRLQRHRKDYAELTKQLAQLGFIWGGSVQSRWLTCGNKKCVCHQNPKARHGPYYYWTSKKAGKTVSRLLAREEASVLLEWVQNRRTLDALVRKMKAISERALKYELKLRAPD
jgi:hypothetical protein